MGARAWAGGAGLALVVLAAAPATARPRCADCEPYFPGLPDEATADGGFPGLGVPDEDLPFGWDDRSGSPSAPGPVPYSQGFVLTYTVRHATGVRRPETLGRYPEVGAALAACWAASPITTQPWREVTLRVSFKQDGSVNGLPRIQHLEAPGDAEAQNKLRANVLSTLQGCAPLPFSPSLGKAIAGQIFAIRFIQAKDAS